MRVVSRKISSGDLVRRRYYITEPHRPWAEFGVVVHRDNNGFLDILWGSKIEHMWDDYDLMRVEEPAS